MVDRKDEYAAVSDVQNPIGRLDFLRRRFGNQSVYF